MINSLSAYYDAGRKAGQAMKGRDMSLYNFMRDWYRKAQRLENDHEKTLAGMQWDAGYHEGRGAR
jgi:hypothetical protein